MPGRAASLGVINVLIRDTGKQPFLDRTYNPYKVLPNQHKLLFHHAELYFSLEEHLNLL